MNLEKSQRLVSREVGFCASVLAQDLYHLYWAEQNARTAANPSAYPKLKAPDISFNEDDVIALFSDHDGEIFEHWIVSDWLASKLRDKGEKIVNVCNLDLWCRTTTGQAIYADEVMVQISEEYL